MSVYDYTVKKADGTDLPMSDERDSVLIIVNTASKCGFTPQFEGLEALYKKYHDKGLQILGFPCNQFKEQDPGSNNEIQEFCKLNYGVTFPVLAKIDVNGPNAEPLYTYLKSQQTFAGFDPKNELTPVLEGILGQEHPDYKETSDIKWNFTKFIVDRNGNVVARCEPTTTPEELDGIVAKLL